MEINIESMEDLKRFVKKTLNTPNVTKLVVLVVVLAGTIYLAKYIPSTNNLSLGDGPLAVKITRLDPYRKYIEVETLNNTPTKWKIQIQGTKMTKKSSGNEATASISDFRLGQTLQISTSPTGIDKENSIITPILISIL